MNTETWSKISDEYNAAKKCLWCPKHASEWRRDDDEGMYHLWNAYHLAVHSEEKDDLLYARVLMMMSRELHYVCSYTKFHKYVEPAMKAYERAIKSGRKVGDKELNAVRTDYETLNYELEKTKNTPEQIEKAYAFISGLNEIDDFAFHDSKPIYFEHDCTSAKLKLQYDSITVTLEFDGLLDIEICGDPTANWITDFYCYRMPRNADLLVFDIGYYKILCKSIKVVDFSRSDN